MDQIQCPNCTYLNLSTNTHCDVCDNLLVEGLEENPLEEEFMSTTGADRSVAQEYLKASNNKVDFAVSLYFQDQEIGITNQEYIEQMQPVYDIFRSVANSLTMSFETPKNVSDYVCQMLYRRGTNKPHHCVLCDSRAYLMATKIISQKDSINNIIRMIPREDLEVLNVMQQDYPNFVGELLNEIQTNYVPLIVNKLSGHIEAALVHRDKLMKDGVEPDEIEESMDENTGSNFRTIWDSLSISQEKKSIEDIKLMLEELIGSSEFHSYLNESWETEIYNHPASKESILNLNKVILTKDSKDFDELKECKCAICMDNFTENKEVTRLECHSFCSGCINEWLENHNDCCPICRKKV